MAARKKMGARRPGALFQAKSAMDSDAGCDGDGDGDGGAEGEEEEDDDDDDADGDPSSFDSRADAPAKEGSQGLSLIHI